MLSIFYSMKAKHSIKNTITAIIIALLLMAAFYAVPLRRSSLTTVAEYLVTDYGKPAGWLATFSACAGIFFSIVASTLTALHLIAGLFGVPLLAAAAIVIAVTLLLVFFGASAAAVWPAFLRLC